MTVTGPYGVVLDVPDIEAGIKFYTDAGLVARRDGNRAYLSCRGQNRDAIVLIGGAARKRLNHIALAADPARFKEARAAIVQNGGTIIDAPKGFDPGGIWLRDPHGMTIHLIDAAPEVPLAPMQPFEINGPGHVIRKNRSAMPPKSSVGPIEPLRLGHILVFTPDVLRSIDFFSKGLGMGLADRAQDVVAFMCARKESDHHVVAFAKSSGYGFHHTSFQVTTPDEVGIGGARLLAKSKRGDWGFGRHTIGSNFFHYIQDPWGSWFEYYSDIDYINDHDAWTPTNYGLEDSLEQWGPKLPEDFVHNYEVDPIKA